MPWRILTAPGLIFCTSNTSIRGGSDPVTKEDLVCLSSVVFATEIGARTGHRTDDCKLTDSSLKDRWLKEDLIILSLSLLLPTAYLCDVKQMTKPKHFESSCWLYIHYSLTWDAAFWFLRATRIHSCRLDEEVILHSNNNKIILRNIIILALKKARSWNMQT